MTGPFPFLGFRFRTLTKTKMVLPSSMKAWQYQTTSGSLENKLQLVEITLPTAFTTLKSDEVLIRVHAASINPYDHKTPRFPFLVL